MQQKPGHFIWLEPAKKTTAKVYKNICKRNEKNMSRCSNELVPAGKL
jgi:hypothetical protein